MRGKTPLHIASIAGNDAIAEVSRAWSALPINTILLSDMFLYTSSFYAIVRPTSILPMKKGIVLCISALDPSSLHIPFTHRRPPNSPAQVHGVISRLAITKLTDGMRHI